MTRETIIEQLQQVIDTHRKEAHVTCPETCWCWDIEKIICSVELSLPPTEGAEEILASLIESLGEPDNSIHDHSYEIRPLTVNGKCEWWMFHNGVGSGEPLAQWLQNFATLHAQRIADKMVENELNNFVDFINDKFCKDITGNMLDKEDVDEFLKSRYYLKRREI